VLDIGFGEIVLIFGLALVVLGPEKLPRVAAQVGRWIGRARGMARQFREQLEEEVNLEEARKTRPSAITQPPVTPQPIPVMQPLAASVPSESAAALPPPAPVHAELASTSPDNLAQISPEPASEHGMAPPPQGEPEQTVYPDHYSHAHPTDSLGRPLDPPTNEPAPVDSGQQDWVGGAAAPDKPAETPPAAAYAAPHERGT
jgi:sec-independent protein translocase protein TatB